MVRCISSNRGLVAEWLAVYSDRRLGAVWLAVHGVIEGWYLCGLLHIERQRTGSCMARCTLSDRSLVSVWLAAYRVIEGWQLYGLLDME